MSQGTSKRCSKCCINKAATPEFFNADKSRADGFYSWCRECTKGANRAGYRRLRDFINSLKDIPCTDCDTKYPPYVMQFDHVRGEKKFNIGQCGGSGSKDARMMGYRTTTNLKLIAEEAAKCQVVCANCHSIRTHTRRVLIGEEEP